MNLSSLPEEVIVGHILPMLEWNDLLRLRKVCKSLNAIVQGYMKVHPELAPEMEMEINEKERTFGEFMKLGIPATKLFVNNISDLGHGLYDKQWNDIRRFLQDYGPLVKSLRVKQVSLYVCGKELEFLEALVNLEEFEAGHYALGEDMEKSVLENLKRAKYHPPMTINYPVPQSFSGLKVLKIGRCDLPLRELVFIANPLESLLEINKLEYLTPPMGPEFLFHPTPFLSLFNQFEMIRNRLNLEDYQGSLKTIDFANHHDILPGQKGQRIDIVGSRVFYPLLESCARKNVLLKNVAGIWLQNPPEHPFFQPEIRHLGAVILSLVDIHPVSFWLDMSRLERIKMRTSRSNAGDDWFRTDFRRRGWPALKSLDLHVDSVMPDKSFIQYQDAVVNTKSLLRYLFEGVNHTAMTELRISFEKDDGSLPIPKMEDVVASCPNLKKLVVVQWPGTNEDLIKLWNGLPKLEEVSLEYCKDVGNYTFVGANREHPAFCKLKNLKKLTLKGLDQMPKITDLLFTLVIRYLSLTHFIVTSDGPVESVSSFGVESLLYDRFGETIQKFPFQDWSLSTLSSEEWKKLEKKFRT